MKHKIIFWVMVISLSFIFSSCAKNEYDEEMEPEIKEGPIATQNQDAQEPEHSGSLKTIDLVFPGYGATGRPYNGGLIADMLDAVNAKLAKDLNAQVHFSWQPYEQYSSKVMEMLASGAGTDAVDTMYEGSEVYNSLSDAKLLYDIRDDFVKYMPATYKTLLDEFDMADELLFTDGKLYAIPVLDMFPVRGYIVAPKELYSEYGEKITTLEDYEGYMQWILENKPDITPCYFEPISILGIYLNGNGYIQSYSTFYQSVYEPDKPPMPIESLPEFKAAYEMLQRWDERGYRGQTTYDGYIYFANTGKLGSILYDASSYSRAEAMQLPTDYDFEYIVLYPDTKMIRQPRLFGVSLLSSADATAETLQFFEMVYSDREYYDLIHYGIEDKHYKKEGQKVASADSPQYSIFNWWGSEKFNNYDMERPMWSEPEDYAAFFKMISLDSTLTTKQLYEDNGIVYRNYAENSEELQEVERLTQEVISPLLLERIEIFRQLATNISNWNFSASFEEVISMLEETNAKEISEAIEVLWDYYYD